MTFPNFASYATINPSPSRSRRGSTQTRPPVSLLDRLPDLDPRLDAAVRHCLEKAPEQRYSSVAEFARAIAPFGTEASRASVERIARCLEGRQVAANDTRTRERSRSRAAIKTAAAFLVSMLLMVFFMVNQGRRARALQVQSALATVALPMSTPPSPIPATAHGSLGIESLVREKPAAGDASRRTPTRPMAARALQQKADTSVKYTPTSSAAAEHAVVTTLRDPLSEQH